MQVIGGKGLFSYMCEECGSWWIGVGRVSHGWVGWVGWVGQGQEAQL